MTAKKINLSCLNIPAVRDNSIFSFGHQPHVIRKSRPQDAYTNKMENSEKINSTSILNSFLVDSLLLKLTSTQSLNDLVPPRHFNDPQFNQIQNNLNDDLKSKLYLIKQNIQYEFIDKDYDYSTSDDNLYQYSISLQSANNLIKKRLNDQFHTIGKLEANITHSKQLLHSKIQHILNSDTINSNILQDNNIIEKFNQLQESSELYQVESDSTPSRTPTPSTS